MKCSNKSKVEVGVRQRTIWISTRQITEKQKLEADLDYPKNEVFTEWKLRYIIKNFCICRVLNSNLQKDLFASRLNMHLGDFVPYRPDPKFEEVSAFFLNWKK